MERKQMGLKAEIYVKRHLRNAFPFFWITLFHVYLCVHAALIMSLISIREWTTVTPSVQTMFLPFFCALARI